MTDFTHDWIVRREQLEEAATEGPWRCVTEPGTKNHALHGASGVDIATDYEGVWYVKGDAEFIADARTALPAALAALRAVLEEEGPRATGDYSEYSDGYHAALDACREAIEAALPIPTRKDRP